MGSGHVSRCWTSAFDDPSNHGFVILKDVQHRTKSRKLPVQWHTVNIVQIKTVVLGWNIGFVVGVLVRFGITRQVSLNFTLGVVELVLVKNETLPLPNPKDQELDFHPCVNRPREKLFQLLLELCETEVCFLHIQLIGTNV